MVFGLSSILGVCVRFAATMTLVPRFDATAVLEVMQRDRVTVFEGVPTMYVAVLNHPELDRYDLSALRVGISGGAPIPAEVLDEFERRLGLVVLEGYGMSETASTTTFNPSADERRVYSIGKPIGASRSRCGTTRAVSCHPAAGTSASWWCAGST